MTALRLWIAALLMLPLAAVADPITVFATLLPYIGSTLAAAAATIVSYSAYIAVGIGIARAASARRKARRAAARQRAEYNAGLSDRSVTGLTSTPAWRVVYGEAITGGDIVAMFTSDKVGIQLDPNSTPRTKPDGYRHLVIVFAAHEVEQIGEVYIDGVPLGALDSGGWVTGGEFYTDAKERAHVVSFTGSLAVPYAVGNVLSAYDANNTPVTITLSSDRKTIYGPAGVPISVYYVSYIGNAAVRCSKHAGLPTDPADPYLMSVVPDKWTAAHVLRGRAYIVLTLDLEQQRFQGGPPGITASIKGRRVYDPRKDSTRGGSGSHRVNDPSTWQWSSNPALCARDWLCAPWGYECDPLEDIDDAYTVAAANACDAVIPVGQIPPGGTEPSGDTGPMYTCNGVLQSDGGKEAQLEEILESMVGDAVYGAQWMLIAGAWTAPVGTLTDDDLHGQIEIVQAGAGTDELFNGVRGTYIPAGKAQPIDFEPYQNPTFLAADGRPLWEPVELTYVNDKQRAKIISRILVERARSSQVIKVPAKLRAWRYRVGERLNVRSTEYSLPDKTYRITDWQFGLDAPVTLLLEEDAAEIWDLADAVVADPTPNTDLPSPWVVAEIAGLTANSGTTHLQLQADGTVVSRVWVSWTAINDAYVTAGGRVRVRWVGITQTVWSSPAETTGDAVGLYLTGVRDGQYILIEAVAINALGQEGPPVHIAHRVLGKTEAPRNVPSISYQITTDGVVFTVPQNTDLDRAVTELRVSGIDWDSSVPLVGAEPTRFAGTTYLWPRPAAGIYRVRARYIDTTGNDSLADAYVDVTIGAAELVAWGSISGRPKLFRVGATGFSAAGAPIGAGLYDGETGAMLVVSGRSYAFARIRRSDGVVTYSNLYDVFAEGTDAGNPGGYGRGSAALAADLTATGNDSIVVVFTGDEPWGNRLQNGLSLAMLRCGASRAVFASPEFRTRSAYVLIGIGGCGEGNGFEAYQGAVDNDPNAWVDVSFQLASGQLIVTGSGATPRTLRDYAYTGDLNATGTLRLVARNGCTTSGSSASKASGTPDWNADVYSRDGYAGGAYAAAVADRSDVDVMFGLDRAPTDSSAWYDIDAAIYLRADGQLLVSQSGNIYGPFSVYNPGDRFAVLYDGTRLHYLRNGAEFWSFDWLQSDPLYFDSSFVQVGASISGIEFGPLSSIRRAVDAANAAQTTANTASVDAYNALAGLNNIASDDVLSRLEKSRAIQDWNVLANEQAGILGQADNYGVTTERGNYTSAVSALASYLVSLSPSWADLGQDTPISGATWRDRWFNAYTSRQAVLDKIAANAKARLGGLATLNSVGTGQIDPNAATEVYVVDGGGADVNLGASAGSFVLARQFTYTPPVDSEVTVTVDGWVEMNANASQWSTFAYISNGVTGSNPFHVVARNVSSSLPQATGALVLTQRFFAPAGVTRNYQLLASADFSSGMYPSSNSTLKAPRMRIEVIKR